MTARWTDRFVATLDDRDGHGWRDLVAEDVEIRIDGALVASNLDDLDAQISVLVRAPDGSVEVRDVHVAGDAEYALFATGGDRPVLAYGILELREEMLVRATCFLSPARDVASEGVTIDVRPDEPIIDLTTTAEALSQSTLPPPPPPRRTLRSRLAVPLTAIGSWIVQDLLLAAPVVAIAARYGSVTAYAVFAPAYALLSLVLTMVTIRLLRRPRDVQPGRFARWLASAEHHPRTLQWLRAGGVVGFVLSSYLLSGPPTVWALHRLGFRRRLVLYGILASVTWGLTFVLSYLLVAEVAFL